MYLEYPRQTIVQPHTCDINNLANKFKLITIMKTTEEKLRELVLIIFVMFVLACFGFGGYSCYLLNRLELAKDYIECLEEIVGEDSILDCISGTDEYLDYYGE